MKRHQHANGVITYTFDSLAALPVRAYVSTRHGGVSPAPWNSLNFSVRRGDTPERVQANRLRFAEAVGVAREHLVSCRQVHGTGVAKVDWADAGQVQEGVDAAITDAVGLPLGLVFADCAPLLLYDPVRHVLGVCHAGWRGTVNGATAATVWALQAAYGTEPGDLRAAIGPSIGPASYEVGDEVVEMVRARLSQPDAVLSYPHGAEGRAHLDLWRANALQLIEAGVPEAQIEVSAIDTAQHTDDFFSHRAEQGRCGLFGMMAWLTPKA
ncbi:MAG: peptidoglycan editing factor PgeF [Caldilineaceae bacterium]|nr:peptidoglycan editing factor PgeF [Caldilineaceae bacterium]